MEPSASSDGQQESIVNPSLVLPIKPLPDVVWSIVFGFLKSSDLLSLSKTGIGMKRLVHMDRRTEFLQPVILQSIIDGLERVDLLNCRLVCKFWKRAVDNVLAHLPLKEQQPWVEPENSMFNHLKLRTIDQVASFVESINNVSGNPIIGRNLHLENSSDEEDYWQHVSHLLQMIGHEIFHLYLVYNQTNNDATTLERILRLLPSLKNLQLDSKVDSLRESSRLKQFIQGDAELPLLTKVEMFTGIGSLSSPLFRDIMRNCIDPTNLKMMRLCAQEIKDQLTLPNLTFLKIEIEKREDIDSLKYLECPLKSIHIVDGSVYEDDEEESKWIHFDLKELLDCFSQFATTLHEIYMKLVIIYGSGIGQDAVNFPALKRFHVYHFGEQLHAIPAIPSLQEMVFMNSWKPIEYGFSEKCIAEYLVDKGIANKETFALLDTDDGNHGTNDILNDLRLGSADTWSRFENLKTVWCSSYKFDRK